MKSRADDSTDASASRFPLPFDLPLTIYFKQGGFDSLLGLSIAYSLAQIQTTSGVIWLQNQR